MSIEQNIFKIYGRVNSLRTYKGLTTVEIDPILQQKNTLEVVKDSIHVFFYSTQGLTDAQIGIFKKAKSTDAVVVVTFTHASGRQIVLSVIPTVSLTIDNTSGKDLLVAFLQGGLPEQTVDQLCWLNLSGTAIWEVPNNPMSNEDLLPYMQDIANGATVTIYVPSYSESVGFRCLVSDTAYKNDALKVYNGTNYMAFPNLMTATYIFDKFEAGLTEGTPGIWNITAVDFLGIPMQLTKGSVTVGYKDGVTASGMHSILKEMPTPYGTGGSVSPNTAEQTYRFFSPQHLSAANTCLDTAIINELPKLASSASVVKYGVNEFSDFRKISTEGSPVVGQITCTSKLNGEITLTDVSTSNAFAGTIGINGENNSIVVFGALIAAALCRGVLGNPENWGDIQYPHTQCPTPWNYYPDGKESDTYAKVIHEYSIDGKNYGFSYDDYFGDEAGFIVAPGQSVSLTIMAISGDMSVAPNPAPMVRTGCLAVEIPDPSAQEGRLGAMSCNGYPLDSKSTGMCFLKDHVILQFANAPAPYVNPEIHIDLTKEKSIDAISYWNDGKESSSLSISGLVYSPSTRQLTFGENSSWIN